MLLITRWIASAALFTLSAMPASAHHSISGAYDTGRQVTVEGVITEVQFVHPHPSLAIEVAQGGGSTRWVLELDNRRELVQAGMSSETLKPGDRVVVTGNPARARPNSIYVRRLDRPSDGFRYEQVDRRPRIRSAPQA